MDQSDHIISLQGVGSSGGPYRPARLQHRRYHPSWTACTDQDRAPATSAPSVGTDRATLGSDPRLVRTGFHWNQPNALFICASAFELLEKLADDELNSWLFDFGC
jgi:hypothetical protein